jgi:MFS family permease
MSSSLKSEKKSISPKVLIFLTVFLYLVGFGVIIPIMPLLGKELGGSPTEIGILMAVFSFMQFVFAPMWGQLSDRHGRRLILVGCLLGEALTYIWFGLARSLEALMIARALAGFFGASISTASAYISDITPTEERSKGMAIIGAAFGLGFVVGPAIGGALVYITKMYTVDPMAGSTVASFFVALICFLTFIFAFKKLPESLPPEKRGQKSKIEMNRIAVLFRKIKVPVLSTLIFAFFSNNMAMALMESTLVLYLGDRFGWAADKVSFGFVYVGIVMIITQGYLVRKLIPKIGERNMIILGLTCLGLGMFGIVLSDSSVGLAIAMTLIAMGNGFSNPSILGSISLASLSTEQGMNLGVAQSISSLGRILGPPLGGLVFQRVANYMPFSISGIIAFMGTSLIVVNYARLPNSRDKKQEEAVQKA